MPRLIREYYSFSFMLLIFIVLPNLLVEANDIRIAKRHMVPPYDLQSKTISLIDFLNRGTYDRAVKYFNLEELRSPFSSAEQKLQSFWQDVIISHGSFVSLGSAKVYEYKGYRGVLQRCHFMSGTMDLKVFFNDTGNIVMIEWAKNNK